jgi:hypothetical protein
MGITNIFQHLLVFIEFNFYHFYRNCHRGFRVPSLLIWHTEKRLLCGYLLEIEDMSSLNTCSRVPSSNSHKRRNRPISEGKIPEHRTNFLDHTSFIHSFIHSFIRIPVAPPRA